MLGGTSTWSKMLASGSVTLNVGAVGGTLQVSNEYSEIKAGTDITISSGSFAPSATGQLELAGQIQAVGTITVTSNGSINLGSADLVSLGNITLQAVGNVNLSAGIVNSQKGDITITADSGKTGAGSLVLAGSAPVLLTTTGSITLNGENVAIGSSTAFARLQAEGDVSIFADYYPTDMGTVSIANAGTQIQAVAGFQIGSAGLGAGTPDNLTISGGSIDNTMSVAIYALGSVTIASTAITSDTTLSISANDDITLNSDTLITAGGALALLADASGNTQGTLSLASNVTITDPGYTVTLSGYTISNDATITDGKLVSMAGQ
jgi:filamentous hemagglutinin